MLIINSLIAIVTIYFLIRVLMVQITLKHLYKNGLSGYRIANILTTLLIAGVCIMRITFFLLEYFREDSHSYIHTLIYYLNGIFIFVIALINYLFYCKGNLFNFLNLKK